jgi:hypothetical protein
VDLVSWLYSQQTMRAHRSADQLSGPRGFASAAMETAANLQAERIRPINLHTIASGFSGLVESEEFAKFLRRES